MKTDRTKISFWVDSEQDKDIIDLIRRTKTRRSFLIKAGLRKIMEQYGNDIDFKDAETVAKLFLRG